MLRIVTVALIIFVTGCGETKAQQRKGDIGFFALNHPDFADMSFVGRSPAAGWDKDLCRGSGVDSVDALMLHMDEYRIDVPESFRRKILRQMQGELNAMTPGLGDRILPEFISGYLKDNWDDMLENSNVMDKSNLIELTSFQYFMTYAAMNDWELEEDMFNIIVTKAHLAWKEVVWCGVHDAKIPKDEDLAEAIVRAEFVLFLLMLSWDMSLENETFRDFQKLLKTTSANYYGVDFSEIIYTRNNGFYRHDADWKLTIKSPQ